MATNISGRCLRFGWTAAAVMALLLMVAPQAPAQTFQVIHTFTGGNDGASPTAGLIADRAANLYGTASAGGVTGANCPSQGCGTVFRLKPSGGSWLLTPLYLFQGGTDGYGPYARMVLGPEGLLYGTTAYGGGNQCLNFSCGTAFKLSPRPTVCRNVQCAWIETVIHRFAPPPDAGNPSGGPLVFDPAGNLYGTGAGGCCEFGTVYELTPSGGGWSENIIHDFNNNTPFSGVVLDAAGNLYGTDEGGGYGGIYQVMRSGSGWSFNQLYSIINTPEDGYFDLGGLIFDSFGNLYGTTTQSGPRDGGTVFELSAGSWAYGVLYSLDGSSGGGGPEESLAMDSAGNLYGTTYSEGAFLKGSVFELSPSAGGGWTYTDLHDFTGGSDGAIPISNVVIDEQGNLYGTTSQGGSGSCNHGCGVVWEITP